MREAGGRRGVGARCGEGADVQLVDDRLVPGRGAPGAVFPGVGARVDDLARPVDAMRIAARGGIWHFLCPIDAVAVETTRTGGAGLEGEPALGERLQGCSIHRRAVRIAQQELHALRRRRPQPETHLTGRGQLRAEGHLMSPPQRRFPVRHDPP